jgi:hypothetical protein
MSRMRWLNPSLIALMDAQGGVFTAAQARAHGHVSHDIRRLKDDKVLSVVRRGVYAWRDEYEGAAAAVKHRIRVAALHQTLTAPAVLTHQSASTELGLELLDPDLSLLHVTREADSGARIEAGVQHHVAELPECHVIRRRDAMDLSTVARTAIDVARDADDLKHAVAAIDSALRMGVEKSELREVFELCRSWPGARFVGRALDLGDGRAANPGESWSRVVLIEQGVAPRDLQVRVDDEEGLVGYADFGWDGVLGEFDGKGKYGIGAELDATEAGRIVWREKRREDRMRVRHEVVRWAVADLHQPRALGARVRAAMARAAERGGRSA